MNTLWLGAPVILSIQDLAMALIFGKYSKRPATQNRYICRYSLLEKLTNCTNKSTGPGMLCAGMLKNRDLLFIYLQKKVE